MLDADEIAADARRVAALALAEDGPRDITSDVSIVAGQRGRAAISARKAATVAGCAYAGAVVAAAGLPPIVWLARDGDQVRAGTDIGTIAGPLAHLLRAERPLLNLLQRAAGIATLTRQFADRVSPAACTVLHTRKTTPGLRLFEIAAVLAGGGGLHRRDLAHALMIKDNHWQALRESGGTLADALADARRQGVTELSVEVESLDQLRTACAAGATRLLIDNQTPATVRSWLGEARSLRPEIEIEATGGITLATVRDYALAGVDYVSVGALTHSVPAADIGLEVKEQL